MGFLPSTGDLATLDQAIQEGRGVAAAILGQTYAQYRLSSSTNNCVISGTPVASAFPARLRRTSAKAAIEGAIFDLACFQATCDNRTLVLDPTSGVQDFFVENGYEAMPSDMFALAQIRPTRETLWMRVESFCQITRATPGAGNPDQYPDSGGVAIHGMQGVTGTPGDAILTLTGGAYSFESSGSPASIPCGLQPLNRVRDGKLLGTPTDQPRAHYLIYVPLFPGEQLQEYDRIKFPNGDSYEVLVIQPGITGLVGYVTICEKRAEG